MSTTWKTLREWLPDGQIYGYQHHTGIRLIDVRKHPVHGYDPSGKWNVFAPGNVFPVNAGTGTAKEWKTWVDANADKILEGRF